MSFFIWRDSLKEKNDKITKFPRRLPKIHIDFIILVFFFIYIVFHAVSFFAGTHIPVTEVKQGEIVENDNLTAVAIRKETLVKTDASGQAVYIIPQGSIASKGASVLGVDGTGEFIATLEKQNNESNDLSDDQKEQISELLSNFNEGYSSDNFSEVYQLKQTGADLLNIANGERIQSTLNEIKKDASAQVDFTSIKAPAEGLVCLSYDSLNGISDSAVSDDTFDLSRLKTTELSSGDSLSSGDVAFRLVTDDNWELVCQLSDDMASRLRDKSVVEIRFEKDQTTAWANVSISERGGKKYLRLSLDDSMDRFAENRFLDIELMLDQINGLKVPDSSILQKVLYQIPARYVTNGGDSKTPGVYLKTSDGRKFRRFRIYQKNDDGSYWASFTGAENGNSVVNPDSLSDELALRNCEVKKTYGVYLANKGYTQFVQVNMLYRNDQYSIIEPVNDNELRLYDRVVLKAKGVKDGQMLNDD